MSFNRSGYIGRAPGDSSITIARKSYEPTGVQTDFTFSAGYDNGYCDVYLNGVKLIDEKDYTATNGSTVGLNTAANSGDVVEIIAYKAFNLGVPLSDITGDLSITGSVSASSSITATNGFYGDGSNLTGVASTDYIITGTAATFNSQVKVLNLNVTGITSTTSFNVGAATTIDGGGINVTGVITATSFSGDGSSLTGVGETVNVRTNTITVSGVSTFTGAVNVDATTDSTSTSTGALIVDGGVGIAKNVYIGAGLSVAGTLTYEDVTNVDSVGVVTAKSGVNITGGQLTVGSGITMGIAGVATFADGSATANGLHFGSGGDLKIYSDGSTNIIDAATSNAISFRRGGSEQFFVGSSEFKGGDDKKIKLGTGDDFQFFHSSNENFIRCNATASPLYVDCTENLHIRHLDTNGSNSETMIKAVGDGAVEIYYDNSKKFESTNDGVVVTGIVTTSAGVAYTGLLREAFAKTDGKLSDNTNIDLEDGMVHYFTTTESTTSTPNLRWNSSFSLNNKMNINDAITVTIITSAAAAGYSAQLTIDGSAVTEQWVGGAAPSAGGADGYDIYTYNILKTASATFLVIGNLVNAT